MIHRDIHNSFTDILKKNDILCIKGFQQTGKTTTLKNITDHLDNTKNNSVITISVKETLWDMIWLHTDNFVQYISGQYTYKNKKGIDHHLYICIDDLDLLPHPVTYLHEIWNKLHQTRQFSSHITFITTVSQDIFKQSLNHKSSTKKKYPQIFVYPLYPFSWSEIVHAFHPDITDELKNVTLFDDFPACEEVYQTIVHNHYIQQQFRHYVKFGGFPQVVETHDTDTATTIIQDIVHTYFNTVAILTLGKKTAYDCFKVFSILIECISEPTKHKKIFSSAGLNLTDGAKCLSYLKRSLLFSFSSPFYTDTRYEITKQKTPYLIDHGITQYLPSISLGNDYRQLTNMIYNEVLKSYMFEDIFSYRTTIGKDLPLIAQKDNSLVPIDLYITDKSPRPHSSLKTFMRKYNDTISHTVILTNTILKKEGSVWYIPFILFPLLLQHEELLMFEKNTPSS